MHAWDAFPPIGSPSHARLALAFALPYISARIEYLTEVTAVATYIHTRINIQLTPVDEHTGETGPCMLITDICLEREILCMYRSSWDPGVYANNQFMLVTGVVCTYIPQSI